MFLYRRPSKPALRRKSEQKTTISSNQISIISVMYNTNKCYHSTYAHYHRLPLAASSLALDGRALRQWAA